MELRNRQIIDTLDDDDVRDIKYKKEPEIYNENKKKKKSKQLIKVHTIRVCGTVQQRRQMS